MTAVPGFACPHCGAVSYNPNDLREGYCGRCNRWARDPALIADQIACELERLDELSRVRNMVVVLQAREQELLAVHERSTVRVFVE